MEDTKKIIKGENASQVR